MPNFSQPVHVIYGGAHLFRAGTISKLGDLARQALQQYAPDAEALAVALDARPTLVEEFYTRLVRKLRTEPVEDFRIDFEDGYGVRSNDEEDEAASAAARQAREAMLPRFFGIRIKPLAGASRTRALRTLDIFMSGLGDSVPSNLIVTLPKVSTPDEVRDLVRALAPYPSVRIELMIETPQALLALPKLIEAAEGRCIGAHFGAYDYTASLGIIAAHQSLLHPACDFARCMMQVQLAGTGVWLADGATNVLPIPPNRGADLSATQAAENRSAVHRAWKLHYEGVRHSLASGFYQGWDLHPAQLPARFAAVFAFFLEGREAAAERLKNFFAQSARATELGGVFDDAATGRGLINYFLRAVSCGAFDAAELPGLIGLTQGQIQERADSFTGSAGL